MKVAIVAPSPVPFVVGGAEKLWWGMQRYLNEETTHACELFKIPVSERSVTDLLQSYHRFYQLDLGSFDRVISTKYPAFMVRHPDHHLYLQHLLRGCYDTYPADLADTLPWADHDMQRLVHTISREDIELDGIFDELFAFLERRTNDPAVHLFPGPFIRRVLRVLDRRAMEGIRQFSAISQTVKNRHEYFPPAAEVRVIHHPSNLSGFRTGDRNYLFTASRLDAPKRIDLLIRAFMQSRLDLPFLIAGTGPQEAELKKLAAADDRIRFLGFVSDRDLVGYYADAAAVAYAPYDEDYGLITIEAFCSGKPVITCDDSGGVTEFVVDGENGLIARPKVDSLAAALDRIPQLLSEAVTENCRAAVRDIGWERLMQHLLATGGAGRSRRRHAVVVSTYPVFPPVSGGQLRVYHMLRRLACRYDISLVSLGRDKARTRRIAPHFTEYVIPESAQFTELKLAMEKKLGISAADLAFMCHDQSVPAYGDRFRELAGGADLVICAQPYAYPLVRRHFKGFLVYDSHNMEYQLKSRLVQQRDEELLQTLFEVEQALCQTADVTIACAEEDIRGFRESYALPDFHPCLLPNGVDAQNTPFLSLENRLHYKAQLGMTEQVALFIGSCHQPNVLAVQDILSMAEELPELRFIIIGSVANAFVPPGTVAASPLPGVPANVGFTGVVSTEEKLVYLQLADIALNPMRSGSGSNLKLAEYLAAGIPVVSTAVGARGYPLAEEDVIDVVALADFTKQIAARLACPDQAIPLRARHWIMDNFDWDAIMGRYPVFIDNNTGCNQGVSGRRQEPGQADSAGPRLV